MRSLAAALVGCLCLVATRTHDAHAQGRTGTLSAVWGDPRQANAASRLEWYLADDAGGQIRVTIPAALLNSVGGVTAINRHRVNINGTQVAGAGQGSVPTLQATAIQLLAGGLLASGAEGAPQLGSKAYAVLLCKFSDEVGEPRPPADFNTLMSNSYPNLDYFYREASANQMNLVGTQVFGWFTLPQPRSYYVANGTANLSLLASACTQAADATVNFNQFFGIVTQYNAELDEYAWGGTRTLTLDGITRSWPFTWMPIWATQTSMYGVYAHEMGHSLGLPHSSGQYGLTYDSRWDVMSNSYLYFYSAGNSWVSGNTIIYHKYLLGWIPESRRLAINDGQVTTFTLDQSAFPTGGNNPLYVEIPIPGSSDFYTLEARRLVGYDLRLPGEGVIIHRVKVADNIPATVVDPDNNGNPNDAGAMWIAGETFDNGLGIKVQINSRTADGWNITVTPGNELTITSAGNGSGRVATGGGSPAINCVITNGVTSGSCRGAFGGNQAVTLSATGPFGSFAGWGGACSGSDACVVLMSSAKNVTATFVASIYQLNVSPAGSGSGTITSAPAGVACIGTGGVASGACSSGFAEGTIVSLTPSATAGTFTGWSGACSGSGACQVTMSQSRDVIATFSLPSYTLTVAGTGTGSGGGISSSPQGISCAVVGGVSSGNCSAPFVQGTIVTLTATGTTGIFTGWGGDCAGTSTCQLTITGPKQVTAAFAAANYGLSVSFSSTGNGSVSATAGGIACARLNGQFNGTCSASLPNGSSVTLTATPASGNIFLSWGGACSGVAPCQLTMSEIKLVSASFTSLVTVATNTADALLGLKSMNPVEATAVDALGNQNGFLDVGDLVALMDAAPGTALVQAALNRVTSAGAAVKALRIKP